MKHTTHLVSLSVITALTVLTLGTSGVTHAQKVYKTIGPDGKVTFTDRAPNPDEATPVNTAGSQGSGNDTLPYKLRQTTTRYPVTLYTSSDCDPCNSARNLLVQRGVPFSEKTVNTNEDISVLKSLSGSSSLPFGTVGSQHLKGFSDVEWNQYLDAAGYPKQSELPKNWHRPATTPLVATKKPETSAKTEDTQEHRPPPPPSGPSPSNPGGIIF